MNATPEQFCIDILKAQRDRATNETVEALVQLNVAQQENATLKERLAALEKPKESAGKAVRGKGVARSKRGNGAEQPGVSG